MCVVSLFCSRPVVDPVTNVIGSSWANLHGTLADLVVRVIIYDASKVGGDET